MAGVLKSSAAKLIDRPFDIEMPSRGDAMTDTSGRRVVVQNAFNTEVSSLGYMPGGLGAHAASLARRGITQDGINVRVRGSTRR